MELAGWVAAEQPRLGVHQFCLAGLPELLRVELLYALQQRDLSPPPMDPTAGADPAQPAGRGGLAARGRPASGLRERRRVYNSATRGLFRDLRRHLDRAWAQHTGADPFAGDLWQVALLDLHVNASRRWPATQGVVDFRPIELPWLREIVKDWARATRPYLQRLRETLRACQAASHDPDRRRAGRPGQPGRRRLHPHHRRHRPTSDAPTAACTRRAIATCCSTSSARSSNTAGPAG